MYITHCHNKATYTYMLRTTSYVYLDLFSNIFAVISWLSNSNKICSNWNLLHIYKEIFSDRSLLYRAKLKIVASCYMYSICRNTIIIVMKVYMYLYYTKKEMKGTARGCTDHTPLSVPLETLAPRQKCAKLGPAGPEVRVL